MSFTYELPLNPYPENFSISINSVQYQGESRWNNVMQVWVLYLSDSSGNPIIGPIPLIPGVDLLGQFEYLNIGVQLAAAVDHDANAIPGFLDLGSTGHCYVITPS